VDGCSWYKQIHGKVKWCVSLHLKSLLISKPLASLAPPRVLRLKPPLHSHEATTGVMDSVGRFSIFVKTAGSGYRSHFREPFRFSLVIFLKIFWWPLRVLDFWEKNSHRFSALPVLMKMTSPGFRHQFSQASFQNFKNPIF
jgi:hypothetical protein